MRTPAAFAAALLIVATTLHAQEPVDRIVAIVDEDPILASELAAEIEVLRFDKNLQSTSTDMLQQIGLERMIADRLLLAKAESEGLAPAEEDIEAALESSLEGMRSQFSTEEAFLAALESEELTLETLRKRYRKEVRKSLTIRMLVERDIRPAVELTEGEVRAFYEKNRENLPVLPERFSLAQIFLEPEASASAESLGVAALNELKARVETGEDFETLARDYSEGPSAEQGGDLGFFGRGDMDPDFEAAAYGIEEPGGVSDVVKSAFGLHIIQLLDRDGERIRVRHILKRAGAGEAEMAGAKAKAEAIRDSIAEGASFEEMVVRHSSDRRSAPRRGEIGTFAVTDVTPEVAEALAGIEPGGITDVVPAPDGFHIFRLIARYKEGKPTIEEAEAEIRQAAAQQKQQQVYEKYVAKLKNEIFVDIRL